MMKTKEHVLAAANNQKLSRFKNLLSNSRSILTLMIAITNLSLKIPLNNRTQMSPHKMVSLKKFKLMKNIK
jgi:hypothetical protein